MQSIGKTREAYSVNSFICDVDRRGKDILLQGLGATTAGAPQPWVGRCLCTRKQQEQSVTACELSGKWGVGTEKVTKNKV